MRKAISMFPVALIALIVFFLSMSVPAFAANAATEEQSLSEMMKVAYDAIVGGHYVAGVAFTLIVCVALLKRYSPGRLGRFVNGDAGGVLAAFVVSCAGAVATATIAFKGWEGLTLALLYGSAKVAVFAAGGFVMFKRLIVEPLLASDWYNERAPAWLKMALRGLLWIFTKRNDGDAVVKDAEAAGARAVADNPSGGVARVLGHPSEVE